MKKIIAIGVVGVLGLVGGCSSKKPPQAQVQPQAYPDYGPMQPSHGGAYGGGSTYPVANAGGGGAVQPTPVADYSAPKAAPVIVDTVPSAGTKYTVKKGDTLWSIAQRSYGDGKQYKKIASANNIKNNQVNVGQVLTLP